MWQSLFYKDPQNECRQPPTRRPADGHRLLTTSGHKGLLSVDDIDLALRKAKAGITSDERAYEEMSPANRDAICFPIRLLRLANNAQSETSVPPFSELTKMVGQTKRPYNDQM